MVTIFVESSYFKKNFFKFLLNQNKKFTFKTMSSNNISICDPSNNGKAFDSIEKCYTYFVSSNLLATILEYFLGVATVICSCLVFSMIYRKEKKVVFDKILMAHSVVDFVVGAFDLPFYHVFTIFNYWPFGEVLCILWNSLDSALFSISMLIMMYMAFARTLSVVKPATYTNNVFVKNPFLITSLIWIVSLVYWGAINIYYMTEDYQFAQCYIPFVPAYTQFLYFFFGVFIPLVIIIVLSIYVAVVIGKKQRVKRLKNKKNKAPHTTTTTATGEATTSNKVNKKAKKEFKLSPEVRLSIIVLVYIIQYTPS